LRDEQSKTDCKTRRILRTIKFTLVLSGRVVSVAKFSIEAVRKILHVVRNQANPAEPPEQ
jgi:hypothetical protein